MSKQIDLGLPLIDVSSKHPEAPGNYVTIHTKDGTLLATVNSYEGEHEAIAEFVVLACNTHDTLLEACRKMLTRFGDSDLTDPPADDEARDAARAAIAKAK